MSVFPVVKGVRLRATKVNSCGLPIQGPGNFVVTDGFVTVTLSPVMQEAEELEQKNAEGRTCVLDRTPPERKYYNLSVVLCQVNTCLISMFNGWEQELNYAGDAVGFRDQRTVESDYGVALELWTGGKADDDCPTPENDDIFSGASTGKSYGYLLSFGTEFVMGDLEIGASVSNFTLNGITFDGPQWGTGPWNVVPTDETGTPGRLLQPIGKNQQFLMQRTNVAPPEIPGGGECCELDITGLFTGTTYYFGGPAGEPPAVVAPDQPACGDAGKAKNWTAAVTGTGSYTYSVDGTATAALTPASTTTEIETALNAASGPVGFDVTGTPTNYVIDTDTAALLTVDSSGMTGGGVSLTVNSTRSADTTSTNAPKSQGPAKPEKAGAQSKS